MISKFFGATLSVIVLLSANGLKAQSYVESAGQFSRITPGGSARIQGLGGAQIALGGDYSSGLSNPAGLGMYNRSEISLSHGLNSLNTSAKYLGNQNEDVKTKLNIPGFGIVLHLPKSKEGYLGGSIGISLTRINDFNQSISYEGVNQNNSIIDSFLDNANGYSIQQFDEGESQYNTPTGLAYYNYLIGPESILDPPGSDTEYFTDVLSIPFQQETILNKGTTNQWSFSYGGNYKDKLFFGGSLGITTLKYNSSKVYTETFTDDEFMNNLRLDENLDIKGSGINATIGVIARPVDFFQAGLSIATPTFYQLTEIYDASMSTSWKNFDYWNGDDVINLNNESASTDIVTSSYALKTPFKVSGGVAFISKFGFITGDVELINPGSAKYSSDTEGLSFSADNREIRSTYQSAINYRIGAEYRYEIFRVRAGFGVQGNTYDEKINFDNKITTISGGVGVKTKKFFVDFALVNSVGRNFYKPYRIADDVDLKTNLVKGILTVGLNF